MAADAAIASGDVRMPRHHAPAHVLPRVLRWLAFVATSALTVALFWQLLSASPPGYKPFVDYNTYLNATNRFLSGGSLYAPEQLAGGYHPANVVYFGYVYPPPSVLLFLIFRPELLGLAGWLLLNVGLLVGGMGAVVRRELEVSWPTAVATSLVILNVFLLPFADGVLTGNANVGLAGLVALTWVAQRSASVSVAAGLAGIVKVYPAVLTLSVPRLEVTRSVLLTVAAAAAIVVITLPVIGVGAWRDFVVALWNAVPSCRDLSVPCALTPIIGARTARVIALLLASGLAGLSVFARDKRARFLLIAFAMIAPVADLWPHYWLIPLVAAFAVVASMVGPAFQRLGQRTFPLLSREVGIKMPEGWHADDGSSE